MSILPETRENNLSNSSCNKIISNRTPRFLKKTPFKQFYISVYMHWYKYVPWTRGVYVDYSDTPINGGCFTCRITYAQCTICPRQYTFQFITDFSLFLHFHCHFNISLHWLSLFCCHSFQCRFTKIHSKSFYKLRDHSLPVCHRIVLC